MTPTTSSLILCHGTRSCSRKRRASRRRRLLLRPELGRMPPVAVAKERLPLRGEWWTRLSWPSCFSTRPNNSNKQQRRRPARTKTEAALQTPLLLLRLRLLVRPPLVLADLVQLAAPPELAMKTRGALLEGTAVAVAATARRQELQQRWLLRWRRWTHGKWHSCTRRRWLKCVAML